MSLSESVTNIADFGRWSHSDKIKFFAWYIHAQRNKDRFDQAAIRGCYDELHLEKPSGVSSYLTSLMGKKPKEVLHDSRGYYLAGQCREALDKKYGQRQITVQVDKLLSDLPGKISDEAEKRFLTEVLVCFRNKAFRAAIVMAWNLAYAHLEDFILANHLVKFNAQIQVTYPRRTPAVTITTRDDFGQLKESEVIQVCKSANIISNDLKKILDEKLGRRNTAAHPSTVEFTQVNAEDFIVDLVNNIIFKLK